MPDVNYIFKAIQRKGSSYAQRQSVLWPLLNRRSKTGEEVTQATSQLLAIWRNKALELRDIGWHSLEKTGKLQFVRNCPPSTAVAVSEKQLRCCNLTAICPWCYGRYVADLYDKLADLLPAFGCVKHTPLRIFELSNKRIMSKADAGSYLDAQLRTWKLAPINFLSRQDFLGAYYNVTLEPLKSRKHGVKWKFGYRLLMIVGNDWQIPGFLPPTSKHRYSVVTSRKMLIPIIGRTCRYPVGLMHGDAQYVMMVLNARQNMKCSALLGCLRETRR